jgi:2-amino-4-hydroxy-6-hydroxymethyldihydropteridine diphosphokinase
VPGRSARVFLGLGANLGDRAAALAAALGDLSALGAVRVQRVSPLYETEPLVPDDAAFPSGPPPWYLNQVAEVTTTLDPCALLAALKDTETRLGRAPSRSRWASREIDIDILLFDDVVLDEPELTLPHASLTRRRFVLVPLADLAPDLAIPGTGRSVAHHLAALQDALRVLRYEPGGTGPGRRPR